ncbi:OmpA family protein [Phyllobacterium myrsinacearum]|uniref:Outer membrane protein OmpA-like peptidoglycan-associated protein n=1 Tax=Phyllobacterium myrsinacearum TaxID=28101 RepID=A0A839EF41_9HYPH|nr:OmpA family protein [Phyllobacterium myrsinacearum]MBA8877542.1 outer membrane protein OmpA-like peptidoglycan-associated protein [Phyllobacterium myrsinacearum]
MTLSRSSFTLVFALSLLCGTVNWAKADATTPTSDLAGSSDNAQIKRYDGSFIVSYEKFSYTDFSIPLAPLKASENTDARDVNNNIVFTPEKKLDVEGALTRITYVIPAERSPLEVLRNYEDEVAAAKGEVLFKCKAEECGGDATRSSSGGGGNMSLMMHFFHEGDIKDAAFSNGACALSSHIRDQRFFTAKLPGAGGDTYITVQTYTLLNDDYCKAFNGRTIALVHVLEPKSRDKKMVVVGAKEMASSLGSQGSIALYGVYFDTDKTDLKAESAPTLKEIANLLQSDPELSVIIVGHTDNQGKFAYNVDLSGKRAAAVKKELVSAYKIKADRLTTAGAGMMAPVASNDNEEGRAKNRRVVLVKLN